MAEEFVWSAVFKDGSKLYQYVNKKETPFKKLTEKMNLLEIVYFKLEDQYGNNIKIYLKNGTFEINGEPIVFKSFSDDSEKHNYHLVYKRRNQILSNTYFNTGIPITSYFIGFYFISGSTKVYKVLEILPFYLEGTDKRILIRDEITSDSWYIYEDSKKRSVYRFIGNDKDVIGWLI